MYQILENNYVIQVLDNYALASEIVTELAKANANNNYAIRNTFPEIRR